MRADHRRRVVEELGWHCDHPAQVAKLLTEEEAADVIKRGHVTKELWTSLQPRIEAAATEEDPE